MNPPSTLEQPPPASRGRARRAIEGHRAALLALAVVAALYLAALVSLPPEAFTHHDEGAKYLQVRNLRVTTSGLDWSINYPARRLDPGLEFVPFHPKQHYVDPQGRIYLQWPIFLGLLTRIFWKVMGFGGLYVVPFLAGLGTLAAAYALAVTLGAPRRISWLVVPLVGLATPVFNYSLLYFEHTPAALLVTLSLLCAALAVRAARPGIRPLVSSGVFLALAVYLRSELYLLALVLFGALAIYSIASRTGSRRLRVPAIWLAAFALSLVPLWAFYALTEGTLLPVHALWYFTGSAPASGPPGLPSPGLPPLRYIATAGWRVVPDFLFGPPGAPFALRLPAWAELTGLVGVVLCVLAAVGGVARGLFAERGWRLPALSLGLLLLAVPTTSALITPFTNLHGFVLASPFVALALWPPKRDAPSRLTWGVALAYVGLHALVISAFSGLGPISVHEWGQRYLLPAYPALTALSLVAAAGLYERLRERTRSAWPAAALGLWAALAVLGAALAVRGYAELASERAQVRGLLGVVRALPAAEPVVTNLWWLPLNLASDFYLRPFMLAEGDESLTRWASEVKSRGVTRFAFATTDAPALSGEWTRRVPGLTALGAPREAWNVWVQEYTLK